MPKNLDTKRVSENRILELQVTSGFRRFPDTRCNTQKVSENKYSERPKSERPNTEHRRNPNKFLFGMNVFGFRSFGPKTWRSV